MLESIQIKPNVMFMLNVAFINQIKRYVHVKRCIHQIIRGQGPFFSSSRQNTKTQSDLMNPV